jgi:hypothetical protein
MIAYEFVENFAINFWLFLYAMHFTLLHKFNDFFSRMRIKYKPLDTEGIIAFQIPDLIHFNLIPFGFQNRKQSRRRLPPKLQSIRSSWRHKNRSAFSCISRPSRRLLPEIQNPIHNGAPEGMPKVRKKAEKGGVWICVCGYCRLTIFEWS